MSIGVELGELRRRVQEHGPTAFLVTVGTSGQPHVVSVVVEWRDGTLQAAVGRTSAANLGAQPTATVLWPGAPGADYCLIVDGSARVDDGPRMVLEATRAVLHRLADAGGEGPSCVKVLDQRPGRSARAEAR